MCPGNVQIVPEYQTFLKVKIQMAHFVKTEYISSPVVI